MISVKGGRTAWGRKTLWPFRFSLDRLQAGCRFFVAALGSSCPFLVSLQLALVLISFPLFGVRALALAQDPYRVDGPLHRDVDFRRRGRVAGPLGQGRSVPDLLRGGGAVPLTGRSR
jgi:hypothetical protein